MAIPAENITSPTDAAKNLASPANLVTRITDPTTIAIAPAKVNKPFPMLSQLIEPNAKIEEDSIFIPVANSTIPTPIDKNLESPANLLTSINAPIVAPIAIATAPKPFAKVTKSAEPSDSTTVDNTFIASAKT